MIRLTCVPIKLFENPELAATLQCALSSARIQKAMRFRSAEDRLRSLAAGAALDLALSYYHLSENQICLTLGPHGKPFLADFPKIHFNLSHSGSFAVCAIGSSELGVDIEAPRPVSDALVNRVCETTEADRILTDRQPDAFFLRHWTAKEAAMKFCGTGLQTDPRAISVHLAPSPGITLSDGTGLWLWQTVLSGHVISLCSQKADTVLLHIVTKDKLTHRFRHKKIP